MTTESLVFIQAMATVREGFSVARRARFHAFAAGEIADDLRRDLSNLNPTRADSIPAIDPLVARKVGTVALDRSTHGRGRPFDTGSTPPIPVTAAGETNGRGPLCHERPGRLSSVGHVVHTNDSNTGACT